MQHKARPIPNPLVTGSSGQVGFELRYSPAFLGGAITLDRVTYDLIRPDMLRKMVREYRLDVIVNFIVHTATDKAETNVQTALATNSVATGVPAEETRAFGSLLVRYNIGYVFDGIKNGACVETNLVNPQPVYGKSRLAGKEAIVQSGAIALVMHMCWVVGVHGSNSTKAMLKLGRERDSLCVTADQFGVPITAALIIDVTAQIVARTWSASDRAAFPSGVCHLAAAGETTWYGYVAAVLRHAKVPEIELEVDPDHAEVIPVAVYPLPAPWPANSRMNTGKPVKTFDVHLLDW